MLCKHSDTFFNQCHNPKYDLFCVGFFSHATYAVVVKLQPTNFRYVCQEMLNFLKMQQTQAHMSRTVRKPAFCIYAKTKAQISFAVTAKLIRAFVFATRIVQSLYFLNPNFKPLAIFCGCTAWFVSDLV